VTRRTNSSSSTKRKGFDIVDELEKIAGNHQATITQAALNYLLRKPV